MHEKAFPDKPPETKPSAEAQQALQRAEEVRSEVATHRAQVERQIADLQAKLETIAGMATQVQDFDDPLDRLTGSPSLGINRTGAQIQLEAFNYKRAFDIYDRSSHSVYIRGGTGVLRYGGTSYDAYSPGTQITGIDTTCFIYLEFTLATGAIAFDKAATVPVDKSTVIYIPLWYLPYSSGQIEWRNIIDLRGTTLNRNRDHAFRFINTKSTGGTITPGTCRIDGTPVTITGLPATLSGITESVKYWISVDLVAGTATWASHATTYATGSATVQIIPILEITCAGSVITSWIQRRCSDIVRSSWILSVIYNPTYILGKNASGTIGWVAVETFACP